MVVLDKEEDASNLMAAGWVGADARREVPRHQVELQDGDEELISKTKTLYRHMAQHSHRCTGDDDVYAMAKKTHGDAQFTWSSA